MKPNWTDNPLFIEVKEVALPLPVKTNHNTKGLLELHVMRLNNRGSCLVLKTETTSILLDLSWIDDYKHVIPYMKNELNITHLDLLVLTHPHRDHINARGGELEPFLKAFTISEVWSTGHPEPVWYDGTTPSPSGPVELLHTYQNLLNQLFPNGYTFGNEGDVPKITGEPIIPYKEVRCIDGEVSVHTVGDIELRVLHPDNPLTTPGFNADSITISVPWGDTKFLLCGDLTHSGENRILGWIAEGKMNAEEIQADVLYLGHHGMEDASSPEWVAAVNPIICTSQNANNHRSVEVRERLYAEGMPYFEPWKVGHTVVFASNGKKLLNYGRFINSKSDFKFVYRHNRTR